MRIWSLGARKGARVSVTHVWSRYRRASNYGAGITDLPSTEAHHAMSTCFFRMRLALMAQTPVAVGGALGRGNFCADAVCTFDGVA